MFQLEVFLLEANWPNISRKSKRCKQIWNTYEELVQNEKRVRAKFVMIVKSYIFSTISLEVLLVPLATRWKLEGLGTEGGSRTCYSKKSLTSSLHKQKLISGLSAIRHIPPLTSYPDKSHTMNHGRCHLFFFFWRTEVINFSVQFVKLVSLKRKLRVNNNTGQYKGCYRKIIPIICKHVC